MSIDFETLDDGDHCFGGCGTGDDPWADCVHCDCCCSCLGCEYGPRDGMLLYPNGAPWADEAIAAASHSTQPTEEETNR